MVIQRMYSLFLFNLENLVLGARSEFNGFAGPGASSFGVLEYWSVGKNESPNWSFYYPITPPLHHSSRLEQGGKSMGAPSGGSPKPGPLGPDSLLLTLASFSEEKKMCRLPSPIKTRGWSTPGRAKTVLAFHLQLPISVCYGSWQTPGCHI